MTTVPRPPDDRDEAALETRLCAICGHEEGEHELVELGADTRVLCPSATTRTSSRRSRRPDIARGLDGR